jgi:hypothetical protein
VATPPLDPAGQLVDRQRQAAEDLRRDLMGGDGSLDHPYLRSFDRLTRDYASTISLNDLYELASKARIVYVGDFHAVSTYQHFAASLLERLSRGPRRMTLGVEFVYTRQQRWLDMRQAGAISDDEFLRRVHYAEEWGYPWEGYRELLDRARSLGVDVFALDASPRGSFSTLVQRDDHAARRIAALIDDRPDHGLTILFGETHLTPDHLPRRVRRQLGRSGPSRDEAVVLQSPDQLHWRALSREGALPEALRIDDRTFAAMHTPPLQKYEAYRQVLERWEADVPDEEDVDLTPAVHHLIEVLLKWIGIRARGRRLRHRAGWTDELVDVFPEVYTGSQALELLEPILAERGRRPEELDEAFSLLRRRGAFYESRSNSLFLRRYLPGPAAGEGARFLRAALTGRLFVAAEDFVDDPLAAAYGAAYNEALAYVGARLIDPTTECFDRDADASPEDAAQEKWLAAHRDFVRTGRRRPPDELCEVIGRSRPLRRAVARDVGRRVGAILFDRVQAGAMGSKELRGLFTQQLTRSRVVGLMLRWLRQPADPASRNGTTA